MLGSAPNLVVHPGAVADYAAALASYASAGSDVVVRFDAALARVVRTIVRFPQRAPKVEGEVRQARVLGFPYSVIYEIIDDQVWLLAVAHARRRPAYWRSRSIERSR